VYIPIKSLNAYFARWFFGDEYEKFIIKGNKNADLAF